MATRLSSWKSVEPASFDQRRTPRRRIELSSAERAAGDPPAAVDLIDVSTYGCRLAGDPPVATGDRIWVRLVGAAKVPAVVVWNRNAEIGCRFETPIDRRLMRMLVLDGD